MAEESDLRPEETKFSSDSHAQNEFPNGHELRKSRQRVSKLITLAQSNLRNGPPLPDGRTEPEKTIAPKLVPESTNKNKPTSTQEKPIVLVVRLPAEAVLELEGKKTDQAGEVRRFKTEPFAVSQEYSYSLKATWKENGKPRIVERTVKVKAGQDNNVDLRVSANWPRYTGELNGRNEVRVKNPNDFSVAVGLRSEGKGKDFFVPANGMFSVRISNGRFDIYFNYSSDPEGLYQGDSFTLADNGVEIQIVKVVDGNYGIRKVK